MKLVPVFITLCLMIIGCKQSKNNSLEDLLAKGRWIDLTYSFSDSTLYWPNNATGFVLDIQTIGITPAGFYYSSNSFSAPEHGGTHLDAPVHFAEGKQTADRVPLENLTGFAVVINVSEKALKNPDYLVSIKDVTDWEQANDSIPQGSIVLFRTGYNIILTQKNILELMKKVQRVLHICIFQALMLPLRNGWLQNEK
jgi:hypothetical protein